MAPKVRGRKKAEVAKEKIEIHDGISGDGVKAKKIANISKGSKQGVSNEEKKQNLENGVNGSGEPQEKANSEKQVETNSGSNVPAHKVESKRRGRPAKAEEDGDKEESSKVEVEAKSKELPAKRGRKPAKAQNGSGSSKGEENHESKTDIEAEESSKLEEETKSKELPAKRGRKPAKVKNGAGSIKDEENHESKIDIEAEESSKLEEKTKSKELPAKRGRKPAKAQNGTGSTEDEENHESKTDGEVKDRPKRKARGAEAEPSNSVKEQTELEPNETKAKKAKVQSEEDSVEKEVPSKGAGRKKKNAVEKSEPETVKIGKDEKHPEIDENRQLRVALKRNENLDEMARQQREDNVEAVEEPKAKNVKGPAKSKGKRAAKDDAEDSQPSKKGKETASKSKGAAKKEKDKIPDVTALDFSNESKTADGKPWNLKISTWNVNGLRAWLEKNGMSYLHHEKPDILCIQETKCSDNKLPPEVNVNGYHCYWLAGDKDGYSGVGLLSKEKPVSVQYGINVEEHDKEGRVITAEYDEFYLVTTYIPNAGRGLVRLDYRQEWDKDFRSYLKKLDEKKPVVLCGDLNVAHEEIDIANPKSNKKNAGFTKEEREGFSTLLSEGFVDTFRHLYPDQKGAYTFWTYMMNARAKNVGWRLDYFVISKRFVDHLCDSVIRKDVLGSDHCPVALFLHI